MVLVNLKGKSLMDVFYVIHGFLIICLIIFSFFDNKYLEKYLLILIGLVLWFLAGLRDVSVGIDTGTYYNAFYYEMPSEFGDVLENNRPLLFWVISYLIRYELNSYNFLLFITSAVGILLISRLIIKYSSMPYLSFLIYTTCGFYALSLHLVKQYIAMGIVAYSFDYIYKKNLKMFSVVIFIATLFHASAILFFPAYFLAYLRVAPKNILAYLIGGVVSYFCGLTILIYLAEIVFPYKTEYITVLNTMDASGVGQGMIFVYFSLAMLLVVFKDKLLETKTKNIILINFTFMAAVIQVASIHFAMASRVTYYYSMFLILLIPEILQSIKKLYLRYFVHVILIILVICAYAVKFYNLNEIYPYRTFWGS